MFKRGSKFSLHNSQPIDIERSVNVSSTDVDVVLEHASFEKFHGFTVCALRSMNFGKGLGLLFCVRNIFEKVRDNSHFKSSFRIEHGS